MRYACIWSLYQLVFPPEYMGAYIRKGISFMVGDMPLAYVLTLCIVRYIYPLYVLYEPYSKTKDRLRTYEIRDGSFNHPLHLRRYRDHYQRCIRIRKQ